MPLILHVQRSSALARLAAVGVAAIDGGAFTLRRARDLDLRLGPVTVEVMETLHALWRRLDDEQPGKRHRLTRRPSMVEPLCALFETRWAAAISWDGFVRGSGGILRLLAQGWTDARIADAISVSPRTVSRRVAELMSASGASSRFELGVKSGDEQTLPGSSATVRSRGLPGGELREPRRGIRDPRC